jgi:hypothetical protein
MFRWERERQIGSKVLGHWLNQIRKTRKHDGKSNGSEANGVKKRFLLKPISPSGSPKSERGELSPTPGATTPAPLTPNETTEGVSPRARFANAFKRAGTNSPSPQRSANDISTVVATPTIPLTNSIQEKTTIVNNEEDDDEVQYSTSRRSQWKAFFNEVATRISKIWCPADREWTLTSIQVDRISMILFPTAFLIFNLV